MEVRLSPNLSLLSVRMVCVHYLDRQCTLSYLYISFALVWIWSGPSL